MNLVTWFKDGQVKLEGKQRHLKKMFNLQNISLCDLNPLPANVSVARSRSGGRSTTRSAGAIPPVGFGTFGKGGRL